MFTEFSDSWQLFSLTDRVSKRNLIFEANISFLFLISKCFCCKILRWKKIQNRQPNFTNFSRTLESLITAHKIGNETSQPGNPRPLPCSLLYLFLPRFHHYFTYSSSLFFLILHPFFTYSQFLSDPQFLRSFWYPPHSSPISS